MERRPTEETYHQTALEVCQDAFKKAYDLTADETAGKPDTYVMIDNKSELEYIEFRKKSPLHYDVRLLKPSIYLEPYTGVFYIVRRLSKPEYQPEMFEPLMVDENSPSNFYIEGRISHPLDSIEAGQLMTYISKGTPVRWSSPLNTPEKV